MGVNLKLSIILFRICYALKQNRFVAVISFPVQCFYVVVVRWIFGIDIPASCRIGGRLKIFHGYGLVLHPNAVIGDSCILRHGVTIGSDFHDQAAPVIGDGVDIGCNSTIIGDIVVGNGVKIGANTVVTRSIPDNSTVVGINRVLEKR